jgi:hypothetical protein
LGNAYAQPLALAGAAVVCGDINLDGARAVAAGLSYGHVGQAGRPVIQGVLLAGGR